jgi:phosphonate degradation associated HDIG domain protein
MLFAWLSQCGGTHYDPNVTQLQHALQSAHLAEQEGAPAAEVLAALLHDAGHLLANEHRERDNFLARDIRHEELGADWLEPLFGSAVADPVRHHVAAKRYLCATDGAYRQTLSAASQRSLDIQGGPMRAEEIAKFETMPYAAAAVALRRRDDRAKAPSFLVPDLRQYAGVIRDRLRMSTQ